MKEQQRRLVGRAGLNHMNRDTVHFDLPMTELRATRDSVRHDSCSEAASSGETRQANPDRDVTRCGKPGPHSPRNYGPTGSGSPLGRTGDDCTMDVVV
jgi:hypothetical protein